MHSDFPVIAETDVAIIGGGLCGCILSYLLGCEGRNICLIEKGNLCGEASGSNAGSIHEQLFTSGSEEDRYEVDRQAQFVQYNIMGTSYWRKLERDLGSSCVDIRQTGGLLVIEADANLERLKYKVGRENEYGGATRIISREELGEIAPYVTEKATGAVLAPHEGKIDILNFLPVLWDGLAKLEVNCLTHTTVLDINPRSTGIDIKTDMGLIKCRQVVLAGGGWNGKLAKMLGWDLKLCVRPIQCTVTEKLPSVITHTLQHATRRMTLKQNHHGNVVIGGGWPGIVRNPVFPPVTKPESIIGALGNAVHVVPAVAGAQVLRSWASYISSPMDGIPVVGQIPGRKECFILATNTFGITLGPLLANLLASIMLRNENTALSRLVAPARPQLQL